MIHPAEKTIATTNIKPLTPMSDTAEVRAWFARYKSTLQTAAARVWRTLADDAAALLLPVEAEPVRPTAARAVVDATAHYYNVLPAAILGDSRRKLATRARHVAIWLCAKHCREMSLPDLGAFFGRDHTTIYAARTKIEAELKVDSSLPLVMRAIEAYFNKIAAANRTFITRGGKRVVKTTHCPWCTETAACGACAEAADRAVRAGEAPK